MGDAVNAQETVEMGPIALEFAIRRDEFIQEGPSGPIEAKRVLMLNARPMQCTKLLFGALRDVKL